jgi:2-keto-4-pentenoate hydratase/2-oxohepta-3-ene-1,7-dioic acid hydratase in catechol pathway
MRLLMFSPGDGSARFGIETAGGIVDVHAADPSLPATLHEYLIKLDELQPRLAALAQKTPEKTYARDAVTLHPPIAHPQKIICIGLNYRDHAAEVKMDLPEHIAVFPKWPNTLIGDGAPIVIPAESHRIAYDVELTFVIGKRGRHIPKEKAYEYIAGYTIMNDVSIRDYQMRTSQWAMGKSWDTHGPLGPVVVTTDEIPDPQNLFIRTSIGGEMLQDSHTSQMVFGVATIVEQLSQVMTLEPGDIVATGTPAGVGTSRNPRRWMKAGERVRLEIEKIGVLENPLVAAS